MHWRWWVAAAAVLLAAIGLYAWADGDGTQLAHEPAAEFPEYLRPAEVQRANARRLLTAPVALDAGASAPPQKPAVRDPLAAALAPPGKGPGVVIEVNALRHSRLGEMLLRCLSPKDKDNLAKFQTEMGIDPLRDLDRLALSGGQVVASGNFNGLRVPDSAGAATALGNQGKLYGSAGQESQTAVWGNSLALFGGAEGLQSAVDRLEGRAPAGGDWLPESATYGDIYGVLPPDLLKRLLPPDQQGFADRFAQVAQQVQFHVDASNDVAMTFDVGGEDAAGLSDLAQAVTGALAVARLAVGREREPELADLLDQAKVTAGSTGGFRVEMVLPLATIERTLGDCARTGGTTGGR